METAWLFQSHCALKSAHGRCDSIQLPDDALYVILMDALVGCRVDILKLFMQCMVSVLVSKVVQALSVCLIHILLFEINVIQKCLYIKAGAADNYRYLSCFVYLIKCFFCHILEDKYIELVRCSSSSIR